MMDILGILLMVSCTLFIIYMSHRQKNNEKRTWNDGISPWSGKPWICFDMDAQGGRMYEDRHGNYCTISYSVDSKSK